MAVNNEQLCPGHEAGLEGNEDHPACYRIERTLGSYGPILENGSSAHLKKRAR